MISVAIVAADKSRILAVAEARLPLSRRSAAARVGAGAAVGEGLVAGAAESAAGDLAVGPVERIGGEGEDAEDDGAVFFGEPGFDDEAAEHDFGAGVGLAFGHAELREMAVKPEEQAAQAQELVPAARRLRGSETVPRWRGTPRSACRRRDRKSVV